MQLLNLSIYATTNTNPFVVLITIFCIDLHGNGPANKGISNVYNIQRQH